MPVIQPSGGNPLSSVSEGLFQGSPSSHPQYSDVSLFTLELVLFVLIDSSLTCIDFPHVSGELCRLFSSLWMKEWICWLYGCAVCDKQASPRGVWRWKQAGRMAGHPPAFPRNQRVSPLNGTSFPFFLSLFSYLLWKCEWQKVLLCFSVKIQNSYRIST